MVYSNEKSEFIDRLKSSLKESGKTKKSIQKHLGVSYTAVQKWFKYGEIKDSNLKALADFLNADYFYLITGKLADTVKEFSPECQTERDTMIPVLDLELSAGNGRAIPEHIEEKKKIPFDAHWLAKNGFKTKNIRALYVSGDSMEPYLLDGDMVLIDTSLKKIVDRYLYAILLGNDLKIKRLTQRYDGSVVIISDNPSHNTEIIPPNDLEQLHIIGEMVYRSGLSRRFAQ